jgi:hypothetical protein
MQFTITGEQAEALRQILADHVDGEPVTFTKQGLDGALIVAFSLATLEVSSGGTIDEVG